MIELDCNYDVTDKMLDIRMSGKSIGFVPTMGCLHDGHLSLVRNSVEKCDFTVASIFVNPTQFSINEDFDNYPNTYPADKKLLESLNVDLLYTPTEDTLYSDDFSTWVIEDDISKSLCGQTRPTHFKGVLTIVAKLFNIVQPDFAFFGQKDFQQSVLIKKMVEDLNFPIDIVVCPIIRESDGLAMSSRNFYLNDDERKDALLLSKILFTIEKAFQDGETDVRKFISMKDKILEDANPSNLAIEYFEFLNPNTLKQLSKNNKSVLVAIAGKCGATRLIDNIILTDHSKSGGD